MKANARGAGWEHLAERYLVDQGLSLLHRNFHCRLGEIDLIMRDHAELVFIEVRYRKNVLHGTPAETVGWHKQLKIQRAAGIFLSRRPALAALTCRFDVVGISGSPQQPKFDWLRCAFEAG